MSAQYTIGTSPLAATPATPNTAHVREVLGAVKATLGTMQVVGIHTTISAFGPSMEQASAEIANLHRQIELKDQEHNNKIDEVRELIRAQFKKQAEKHLGPAIKDDIARELPEQIKAQVQVQIKQYLPMSFKEQLKETEEHTTLIKNALKNSEARRYNADLGQGNIQDKLEVVLTPKGAESKLFPHNLNSLLHYEDDKLEQLLQEYELIPQPKQRYDMINRFMAHIGMSFSVTT
ncbi:hypothetical protein EIP86_011134 [Pleurotus ostreatoroseus]|nr:hypothetical protein EIP86_011134 [Pleurotus ostreatoroseus]